MSGAQRLRCLGPLIVMAAIFCTSSLPDTGSGGLLSLVPGTLKNLLHIPAYALLAVSLCLALARRRGWGTALLVLVLTFSYGVFDEWHQSFVPGRYVSGADLLRDQDLLRLAQRDAAQIVRSDPALASARHAALKAMIRQKFADVVGSLSAG